MKNNISLNSRNKIIVNLLGRKIYEISKALMAKTLSKKKINMITGKRIKN